MERQNKRQSCCQLQRQRRLLHENPRLRVSDEECFYFVEQQRRPSSSSSSSSSFYLPTTTTTQQQYENQYGNGNNTYVPEICVHPTVRWRVADEVDTETAVIINDDGEFEAAESTTTISTTPVPVFYYANELIRPTIMTITKTKTRTRTRTVLSNIIDEEYPPPSSSPDDSNNNNNNNNNNQQDQEQEQQEDEKEYEHKWMYYSREIIFELMGKNDDGHHTPKHTEQEVAKMMSRAVYTTNVGSHLVFENDYCRLWDFSIRPGGGNRSHDLHHHVLPYAFVFLQHGKLRIYKPATTTTTTARDCINSNSNNNNEHDDDDNDNDEIVEEDKEQTGDNDTYTRTTYMNNNNTTEYVGVMERQSGEVIWSPIANGGFELEEAPKVAEEDDVEHGDGNYGCCEDDKSDNNNNIKSKKWCWKPSIPTAVHSVENDLSDSTFREYMIELK